MKVFSVVGYSKSGKTTTIEEIIKELRRRNYTVGSVKDIHFEGFEIDTEGTNTDRHKKAGSQLVTARGFNETDVLFPEHLDIYKIAEFYDMDYLVLEGVREANVPMILTADSIEDLDERFDGRAFMVSGKISDHVKEYRGLPAVSALSDSIELVDIIEHTVFPLLPDYDPKCCTQCGYSCRELCMKIVAGENQFTDCLVLSDDVQLKINGKIIKMVPFVQNILRNSVEAVVKELDGFKNEGTIEIVIGKGHEKL